MTAREARRDYRDDKIWKVPGALRVPGLPTYISESRGLFISYPDILGALRAPGRSTYISETTCILARCIIDIFVFVLLHLFLFVWSMLFALLFHFYFIFNPLL